jgi:predicted Zn-dependent protease
LHIPPIESIKKASAGNWRFDQSMDAVWQACLEVVSQYQGILSMEKTADGRSLCVIKGRDSQMLPTDEMAETTFGTWYDQWLVIAVYDDAGMTAVSVAIMDPMSGQVRTAASVEQTLFAQVQIQLNSAARWGEKFADVDWEKRPPRPGAPTIHAAQSTAPQDFDIALGNWIGKRLRLELGMVNCPDVTKNLDIVAQRLKDAAGVSTVSSGVHVLASPHINAFALPDGEIYVTSGLLDSAQSIDEIAGVLAHEVDHLKHRDVAEKLRLQASGDARANALRFAGAVAQIAIGCVPAGGGVVATGVANLARNGADSTVQLAVGSGAEHLQVGMVEGFSTDVELRADGNGCKTLYAAGFDPEASLTFLVNLKEQQGNALTKKSLAMSNFVNMEPGLDERIENIKKTLARLKAGATESQ